MIILGMQDRVMSHIGRHRAIENARQAATELAQQRVDFEQTMEEVRRLQQGRAWRQAPPAPREGR